MIIAAAFGWGLLALPGMARRHLRSFPPRVWSTLMAWSLRIGAGLMLAGLVAMAAPTLLEGLGAHHLAEFCRQLIHDLLAGGHAGGGLAAGVLAVILFRSVLGWRRLQRHRRAAVVESWVGQHRAHDEFELVVLPVAEPIALTVGAESRQVVISRGLMSMLDEDEFEMVVRHEVAHLRSQHHRHIALASLIEAGFGWLPMVRASVRAVRFGVERWADEEAAGADPAARRILASALTAAAGCRPRPATAGFGGVEMAAERLQALSAPHCPSYSRWWYVGAGLVSAAAAAVWLGSVAVVGVSLASGGICYF